ncbi:cuticle protein 18.6-like [Daphnia pulex]|uniref:cuticle protein 18.6-like n=1 Tax=Daphnia pulex TaxID=6669 RepID=UPI001EDD82D3|nr:cuticle protein 18.6-like [Daphnia pulex]
MMKFLIFATLIAVAMAGYEPAAKAVEEAAPAEPAPQPYSFGYGVKDEETYNDFDHAENADGEVVTGSYRVALPDGRTQIVTYRADKNGYTADVKYEGEAQYPEYVEPALKTTY